MSSGPGAARGAPWSWREGGTMSTLAYLVSVDDVGELEPEERWLLKEHLGRAVRQALALDVAVGVDRLEPSEGRVAGLLPPS